MKKEKLEDIFFNKIKQEVKVLSNIHYIIDKIDKDGFLKVIKQCFNSILNNEIMYAIKELEKREKKFKNFDLKNQLTNNTYIFKENLKQISNLMVDQIWKEKMKGQKINSTIEKAKKKIQIGTFDEIKEEDEIISSSNEDSLSLEPTKNNDIDFSDEPKKEENNKILKNDDNFFLDKIRDNFKNDNNFKNNISDKKLNLKISMSSKVIKNEISRSFTESELNLQKKFYKTSGIKKSSSKNFEGGSKGNLDGVNKGNSEYNDFKKNYDINYDRNNNG